ncbi:MAG: glycogen debranching enzyme family protein [Candidatus Parcubacteria bacterium]|nr:glycogen debranching enzyme family protein [Leptolyngbyaceae cyanobacterium LF-bin-113]
MSDSLDTREWLLTNGLGSFASGTVCDARSRTYHGWLFAALDPPDRCTLLLSHLDATLEIAGQDIPLSTHFWLGGSVSPIGYRLLRSFSLDPTPTWVWQQDSWQLTREIILPYGLTGDQIPQFSHRVLIRYTFSGEGSAVLRLRPLVGDRSFHHPQHRSPNLTFSQQLGADYLELQSFRMGQPGTLWQLHWSHAHYQPDSLWYMSFHYPEETRRGLGDNEDLYSPGYLTVSLRSGESITLEARVGAATDVPILDDKTFDRALQAERDRLQPLLDSATYPIQRTLLRASDRFIAFRTTTATPTVIAAYPWFRDVGRYTLMALPGLMLVPQRFSLARSLLSMLGHYCYQGLIPNGFAEPDGKPIYNSIDTSLWWIEMLGHYLEASQDWEFLTQQYAIVKQIYKAFTAGTLYNVRIDASDGLVTWDDPMAALTWMDARVKGDPVTPRRGKPIEVNALWYSALCWASQWADILRQTDPTNATLANQARRYVDQAQQVKHSLQRFWNADSGYLLDTIEPDDQRDSTIRPNAVLALSLRHCAFSDERARQVLQVARDRLLTPYGLRSLDPSDPAYIGTYNGGVWDREFACHQGTVWSWLLGAFLRSWHQFCGDLPLPFDGQMLLTHIEQQGCLDAASELFDGDFPHVPRGAVAHGVTIAELVRLFENDASVLRALAPEFL